MNKFGHDENRVNLTLFFWRNLHVIAIEITQVGIWIGWCAEGLSLKGNGAGWEDTVLPVHDAIAVVDEDVGEIGIFRA